jgi:endoglucanase
MDELLKKLLEAPGVSGYESGIASSGGVAAIIEAELKKTCKSVEYDSMGNLISKKGSGKIKIMFAAHMDEIGLVVKFISKEGFIYFAKLGGIDDRVLVGQRVVIKTKRGDVSGIIGLKPPHLMKEEEKKQIVKYEDMFIDIGCSTREEAASKVAIADSVIFEPNAGVLNGSLCYGKAVDNRVGCYVLIKVMERLKVDAEVYGVATVQEEVGLKGAKISAFRLNPDYAFALDTTISGDTPSIKETESAMKLGAGVGITVIEASGRGTIVNERMKDLLINTAAENNIKHQVGVMEGGMTDAAVIHLNREGVLTGVLSIPTRYIHSPTGVFSMDDINSAIDLAVKSAEKLAAK